MNINLQGLLCSANSLTDFVGELCTFFVGDLAGVFVGDFGIVFVGDLAGVFVGDFGIDLVGDFGMTVAKLSRSTFSLQSILSIMQKLEFCNHFR